MSFNVVFYLMSIILIGLAIFGTVYWRWEKRKMHEEAERYESLKKLMLQGVSLDEAKKIINIE
jgi:hypothetical protein